MADTLERVADGSIKRLMIFAPPRSGKSELVSRMFSGHYLRRFPDRFVAIASYSAELAFDLSRASRRNFVGGGNLAGDSTAVKHWETGKGGGLWATGVGGPATGKGFSLGIVDDPVKNAEEASSLVIRNRNRDWWRSVFYTRMEPDAAVIVLMTRWHLDDLAGWLLEEEGGEEPEGWTILSLPSIYESQPNIPASCTLIPDWREEGEPLVPERYPIDKLEKIRARLGNYYWLALHQQTPRPQEGTLFRWDWFNVLKAIPQGARWLAYFDTAGTEGAGDNTAGALIGKTTDGRFVIADCVAGQWSPARKDVEIREACRRWRSEVGLSTVWLEREAGIGGEERTKSTIRALAGFDVHSERPTGSKIDRSMGLSAQAEAKNVDVVDGPWLHPFLSELADFPYGKRDDRVDAAAGAFNKLADAPNFYSVPSVSLIGV